LATTIPWILDDGKKLSIGDEHQRDLICSWWPASSFGSLAQGERAPWRFVFRFPVFSGFILTNENKRTLKSNSTGRGSLGRTHDAATNRRQTKERRISKQDHGTQKAQDRHSKLYYSWLAESYNKAAVKYKSDSSSIGILRKTS
jgi:hypothetical protein